MQKTHHLQVSKHVARWIFSHIHTCMCVSYNQKLSETAITIVHTKNLLLFSLPGSFCDDRIENFYCYICTSVCSLGHGMNDIFRNKVLDTRKHNAHCSLHLYFVSLHSFLSMHTTHLLLSCFLILVGGFITG
jgi:hypothetical protein